MKRDRWQPEKIAPSIVLFASPIQRDDVMVEVPALWAEFGAAEQPSFGISLALTIPTE
jgi:hypothetical protein